MTNKLSFSCAMYVSAAAAALQLCPGMAAAQSEPFPDHLVGDVGAGAYATGSVIRSKDTKTVVLPYAFADYGRLFARVDTLGVKMLPLGSGYLELAGRISQDGWKADTAALAGLSERKTSIPLGLSTMQKTPYGAFLLNAFVDANKSHGLLLDATYAARFQLGSWTFYPQLGLEYRNARYVNYFYGVTPAESAASGYGAYSAGASTTPMLGLAVDVPLAGAWMVNMQLRRKWLDSSVSGSPLVQGKTQNSGFIALSYRFR